MKRVDNIIGVDLGGTNIRAGKVVEEKIIQLTKEPTPSEGSQSEVLDKLIKVITSCIDENSKSIGIGVPSIVDIEKGIVYDVVNIPSWKVVPLKDILEGHFKVPVYVNNDANCFALGEKHYGIGKSCKSIVGLTIGTGMGSGLIFNGKLYEGKNCCAGEFGNIPYLNSNFEHYCSGQFFSDMKSTSAIETHHKALQGDQIAIQLYCEFGFHLGQAIKSILYAYDPEIIILGGSLAKAYDLFKPSMLEAIQDFDYPSVLDNLKIEVSDLEHSAIYGAAALYHNNQK